MNTIPNTSLFNQHRISHFCVICNDGPHLPHFMYELKMKLASIFQCGTAKQNCLARHILVTFR